MAREEAFLANVLDFEIDELIGDVGEGEYLNTKGAERVAIEWRFENVEGKVEVLRVIDERLERLGTLEAEQSDVELVELGFAAGGGGEVGMIDSDELDGERLGHPGAGVGR